MTKIIKYASNIGARCRSPSLMSGKSRIRERIITDIVKTADGPEVFKVEAASRACGSSATKFYTGNNRERRRVISAL